VRVAHELIASYQHDMTSLSLIPGDKGIFDVTVNGTLIFSKHATGRFPESGEISSALQETI
tara:strand:- start:93 stop:275 length:183 start_codon:yes stop_codon:yes gene_type:complete